jgi:hypothetical protein
MNIISIELEESSKIQESGIRIIPRIDGQKVPYAIEIRERSAQLPFIEKDRQWLENLPNQLRRLIEWADENYRVSLHHFAKAQL